MITTSYRITETCPVEGLLHWTGAVCAECNGRGVISVCASVFPDGEAICESCKGDGVVWVKHVVCESCDELSPASTFAYDAELDRMMCESCTAHRAYYSGRPMTEEDLRLV